MKDKLTPSMMRMIWQMSKVYGSAINWKKYVLQHTFLY